MTPYSINPRTRGLADCDLGVAAKDVAAKFRVSHSCVNRLVQRRRESEPSLSLSPHLLASDSVGKRS